MVDMLTDIRQIHDGLDMSNGQQRWSQQEAFEAFG
jgi:hypothetical protein